jgi:hypothetical protein
MVGMRFIWGIKEDISAVFGEETQKNRREARDSSSRHSASGQLSEKLNHKWKPEKSQSLLDKVGINLRLLGALEN